MVETWLEAHRDHIPPEVWEKRRRDWTPEVSADGWARTLQERDACPDQVRACLLIAEDDSGLIVGLAAGAASAADPAGWLGEIGSLYIHAEHRHRGLGRSLVQAVTAGLADRGIRSLHIGVLTTNVEARQFYEALGGQLVVERDFDDDGARLSESVYAWTDITSLVPPKQVHAKPSIGRE